jgi:protein-S-isoprenylcysteine O-methyltransferase Ste14
MPRIPDLGPRGEGWVAIQGILFVLVAMSGTLPPVWDGPVRVATAVLGAALIAGGAVLALRGARDLDDGGSFTAVPKPREGGQLVETGVYGRVRHPIYGGIVLAAFGWGLACASPMALFFAAVLLGFFFLKSTREEAWLVDRFPDYPAYRSRTRRFIPFVV